MEFEGKRIIKKTDLKFQGEGMDCKGTGWGGRDRGVGKFPENHRVGPVIKSRIVKRQIKAFDNRSDVVGSGSNPPS